MTLYLITGETADGDNVDLFVNAPDPKTALTYWRNHFSRAGVSDWDTPYAPNVFEVPVNAPEGVVSWELVNTGSGD